MEAKPYSIDARHGQGNNASGHVIKDQLRHFKHANAISAVEKLTEFVIGFDKCLILRILQIVAANIVPKLARDFSAWYRVAADDFGQLRIGLDRFHEPGARLTFSFGFCWCSHVLPFHKA